MTLILGIETSCDETAVAVVEDARLVRANVVWSQHELHARFGGVVPEVASRAHLERIGPALDRALRDARVTLADLDAVAVGNRPGLIGSLLVGVSAAQALAWSLHKPLIGVNHVHAHLHAADLVPNSQRRASRAPAPAPDPLETQKSTLINQKSKIETQNPTLAPRLGLVVSGGHTSLYELIPGREPALLGRTIDDAVGEAFDKAAVILGLPYPGGPHLDRLAERGDPDAVPLPRSLLDTDSLDFSYSGLKTALLYAVRGRPTGRGRDTTFQRAADDLTDAQRADFAASFRAAAVEPLIVKLRRAVDHLQRRGRAPARIVVGGGVCANALLRRRLDDLQRDLGLPVLVPDMAFCLDNAAMIAGLAHERLLRGETDTLDLPARATVRA